MYVSYLCKCVCVNMNRIYANVSVNVYSIYANVYRIYANRMFIRRFLSSLFTFIYLHTHPQID